MTSIGASGSSSYQRPSLEQLFSKLDTNSDSKVSQDEFVAGRPDEVSESQAAALFGKIDGTGSGAVSLSDFTTGMEQVRPDGQMSALDSDTLMALLQQISEEEDNSTTTRSQADRFSELFQKLDTNSDGSVTKDEFVAGRPDDVSESDASALFDKLDTEQTGALDEQSFKEAMLANGPKGPPPAGGPPPANTSDDEDEDEDSVSSTSSSTSTSLDDILKKLLENLETEGTTTSASSSTSLQDLLSALKSYTASLGYNSTLTTGSLSSSLSSLI